MLKGFQEEYGVKVIESNFDSMEGMYAKLAAGNQYDIVFPIAKWVVKLSPRGQAARHRPAELKNADQVFYPFGTSTTPGTTGSTHSIPFTVYKTGIGWRTDKVGENDRQLVRPVERRGARSHLHPRRPDEALAMAALLLGYDVNTAADTELAAVVEKFRSQTPVPARVLHRRLNNMLAGDAWMHHMWSGDMSALLWQAPDPSIYGFQAPREGAPINSDTYAIPTNAQHPGTALLFIDYMLRPENVDKNINYIYYPMPVHGTEDVYQEIVADYPECAVTVDDLSRNLYFTNDGVAKTQARDAA